MEGFAIPAKSALLLQGGGLRGNYTSGVLDVMMEHDLYFPTVAGVSAGALNAMNYLARQPGRSARINLSYRHDPRYCGPLAVLQSKGVFGVSFLVDQLSRREHFDQKTFDESKEDLYVVATDVDTGKAEFFRKGHCKEFDRAIVASASIPVVSLPVKIGTHRYLDGGCACAIPLDWAIDRGNHPLVVVCTREKGFRKPLIGQRQVDLYSDFYSRSPEFLSTLLTMDLQYNNLMDRLEAMEDAGEIFVIRPQEPITIGQFETDTDKLLALVNRGRRDAQQQLPRLLEFLESNRE